MSFIIRTLLTTLCLGACLVSPALAEEPWPVEGNVSLLTLPPFTVNFGDSGASSANWQLGGELEVGPRNGFWSLGGVAVNVGGQRNPWASTLYGRVKQRVGDAQEWSLLAGRNEYQRDLACADTCEPYTPYGLFVAASWQYRAERFWVRLTPQYVFPLFGDRTMDGWMISMVPWAEVGWRLTPAIGLAFRLGPAPIKLNYAF